VLFGKKKIENRLLKAEFINQKEHNIDKKSINELAVSIIKRLNNFGYEAYIVGGAIRDLIIGKKPKDFDVVTNATPKQIRTIFKNSRIIGKRFKLVHIFFGQNIIEVATFRKTLENEDSLLKSNNVYGSIEDDVIRRDFTINAMYYDIETEFILDYVKGYEDLRNRKIVPLKNEIESFKEDPVRMIRAIKYSVYMKSDIDKKLKETIKKLAKELQKCSTSRLYEEILKIFKSDSTTEIIKEFESYGVLKYILPDFSVSPKGNIDKTLELLKMADSKLDGYYEIYWLLLYYYKIINTIKDNISFNSILTVFKDCLKKFNIPNKLSADLSLTLFIWLKYINVEKPDISRFKSLKNPDILEYLKQLLIIFNYSVEVIESINTITKRLRSKITESKIMNKVNQDYGKDKVVIIRKQNKKGFRNE